MALTPVKTPVVAKKMFPNYVWDMPTSEKLLYLTFDDGPTPDITPWVLDTLEAYQAKATFFCIGKNIELHPNIYQSILKKGHTIGNHTQNHIKGWSTKAQAYLENVEMAAKVMKSQILNSEFRIQNLFRPPYGQITPKQGKQLMTIGYKIIMWDVLSFDWDQTVSKETCLQSVLSKTTKGSIVVFHDSVKASKNMQYTLPKVLEHFSNLGYAFRVLS